MPMSKMNENCTCVRVHGQKMPLGTTHDQLAHKRSPPGDGEWHFCCPFKHGLMRGPLLPRVSTVPAFWHHPATSTLSLCRELLCQSRRQKAANWAGAGTGDPLAKELGNEWSRQAFVECVRWDFGWMNGLGICHTTLEGGKGRIWANEKGGGKRRERGHLLDTDLWHRKTKWIMIMMKRKRM